MSYPVKTFDEFFDAIITDWKNQFPEADTSKGSLIFMKGACLASVRWGLQHYITWVSQQIFGDTADVENLEHHAWMRGISRVSGEDDAELLARYLDYIRRPPAGGNKYDYRKWALSIDNVSAAYVIPLGQGLGTVDVIVLADAGVTGSELPSSHTLTGTSTGVTENKLVDSAANFNGALPVRIGDIAVNNDLASEAVVTAIDSSTQLTLDKDIFTAIGQSYTLKSLIVQVKEYIDDVRPVTASVVRVLPPTIITQAVTLTVTGTGLDKSAIATSIAAYINGLIPGKTLSRDRIKSIAIQAGADDDSITLSIPADNITSGPYEMLRPGTITVN